MNDPVVKNAADESQVAQATEKEKLGRDQELDDLKKILASDYGRRFLWRMLEHGKIFGSIWRQSAEIHYLAGQQDFGHYIMAEILEADEQALFKMMSESNIREKNKKIKRSN